MIGVVLIEYNSYKRTVQYILDLLEASDIHIDGIAIVDNSPQIDNLIRLQEKLEEIGCIRVLKNDNKDNKKDKSNIYSEMWLNSTRIYLIKAAYNLGFAKGNNLGHIVLQEKINNKYTLFSNSDIQFVEKKAALTKLIDVFHRQSDVGLVGPMILNLKGKPVTPTRQLSVYGRWWLKAILWPIWPRLINPERPKIKNQSYVYAVQGSFMLARADYFDKVKGFDEYTFLFTEEEILSERLKKANYKVYFVPAVTVIHEGGHTTRPNKKDREARDNRIRMMLSSDLYYYKKYFNVSERILNITKGFAKLYIFKRHAVDRIVDLVKKLQKR